MDDARASFVEEFGVNFEELGGVRMMGRILGLMLVADPPALSAEEIATALKASRGSVSQSTRLLIQMGLLRRINVPGERRDYFRLREYAWTETARGRRGEIDHLLRLFYQGLRLMDGRSPESRLGLEESIAFMTFWQRKVDDFFAEWEEQREDLLDDLRNRLARSDEDLRGKPRDPEPSPHH